MFQPFANHVVKFEEIVGRDTFPIRRIGDHDRLLCGLFELLEVLLLDDDVLGCTGCFDVLGSNGDGARTAVVSVYLMFKGTLLTVVVVYLVVQLGIEIFPFLEGVVLTEDAGVDVAGDEVRFYGEGSRSAHRVDEVAISFPTGQQDDTCSENFVDRCIDRSLTITTAMQRFTRRVERQSAVVLCDMYVQAEVCIVDAHRWAFARLLAEIVGDGIFYPIGYEFRVAKVFAVHHSIDVEGALVCHVFIPIEVLHCFIHLIGCRGFELLDGLQHADGCPKAEIGFVHHLLVTFEGYHTYALLYILCAYLG
jgi:hypothetical protein